MSSDDFKAFHGFLVDYVYSESTNKIPVNKTRKVFDNPCFKLYLSELMKVVSKKNVLSSSEVSFHKELESHGKVERGIVLDQLVEEHKLINLDLEEQIANLDRSIVAAQEDRDALLKELDIAETMKTCCMEKQSSLHSAIVETNHKLQDSKCKAQEKCQQMESTTASISKIFAELCDIIQNTNDCNNLLAHASLSELVETHGNYESVLRNFVKAYLSEVSQAFIADLQSDECMKASSSSVNNNSSAEQPNLSTASLARAEQWFPNREKQSIESKAQHALACSLVAFYDEALRKLHGRAIGNASRQTLVTTFAKLGDLKMKIEELSRKEIPELVSQLAKLFKSHMLVGDYHAKSEYQQYIMNKQKKVLVLLRHQQIILDVVSIILTGEEAGHQETAQKIHTLLDQLNALMKCRIPETEWLSRVGEDTPATARTLFSGKDSVPLAVARSLSDDTDGCFLRFSELPVMTEDLKNNKYKIENSLAAYEGGVKELSDKLKQCWAIVASSSHESGVNLTQDNIANVMSNLETRISELSHVLVKSCDEIERKKRLLKHDRSAAGARSDWLRFFSEYQNDPT